MVKSKLITNNFTIYNNANQEENENNNFIMDMIMILFVSYFFGNFLEGFEEYLRRPIDHADDDTDAYDIFDATLWIDFD